MNIVREILCRPARGVALIALMVIALCRPAAGQRLCPAAQSNVQIQMSFSASAPTATIKANTKDPAVIVTGGRQGLLTDPDQEHFTHQFDISAEVQKDGSARGQTNFVFTQLFTQKWGALPIVDLMHLRGEFTSGSVAADGTVTLTGPFIETDYSRHDGIVFQEDSRQSGAVPLKIVISPASKKFTLSWCSFIPPAGTGSFSIDVTKGDLRVYYLKD